MELIFKHVTDAASGGYDPWLMIVVVPVFVVALVLVLVLGIVTRSACAGPFVAV